MQVHLIEGFGRLVPVAPELAAFGLPARGGHGIEPAAPELKQRQMLESVEGAQLRHLVIVVFRIVGVVADSSHAGQRGDVQEAVKILR